jgi:membrane protein DedA with SNARE-associated domain
MEDLIPTLIDRWGPLGVGILMFIETVFPPIPSEVIMPLAGIAAAQGNHSLGSVILAGTIGAMLGNGLWFLVAWKLGLDRFEGFLIRYGRILTIDKAELDRARRIFADYGGPIVGIGRILPTVRSLISVPAGLVRMNLRAFLIWSTIGTFAWTMGLAVAGYYLGKQFGEIDRVIGPVSTAVIVIVFLVYLWRVLTWNRRAA